MSTLPSIKIHRTPSPYPDVHDARSYARTVEKYARITHEQSLYPGNAFEALAQFFSSLQDQHIPLGKSRTSPNRAPSDVGSINGDSSSLQQPLEPFATHYALQPGQRADAKTLSEPSDLEEIAKSCSMEKMGQLIILRGYPSASWLCSIGALYDVDPEFFRRHLDFLQTSDGSNHQNGSSKLPSSSSNIFQFRFPTVGSYVGPERERGAKGLAAMREAAQASMSSYSHRLRIGAGWKTGDSIVREYNVHEIDRFSIEQAVTIYFSRLRPSPGHWVGKC